MRSKNLRKNPQLEEKNGRTYSKTGPPPECSVSRCQNWACSYSLYPFADKRGLMCIVTLFVLVLSGQRIMSLNAAVAATVIYFKVNSSQCLRSLLVFHLHCPTSLNIFSTDIGSAGSQFHILCQ